MKRIAFWGAVAGTSVVSVTAFAGVANRWPNGPVARLYRIVNSAGKGTPA